MDLVQIGVLGRENVGRSTLMAAYLGQMDSHAKLVTYRKHNFVIRFLECDLSEIHSQSFNGLIVLFDLTDEDTYFEALAVLKDNKKPAILLGNKADLQDERIVPSSHKVRKVVKERYLYAECSALHAEGIDSCLFLLLDLILEERSTSSRCWPLSARSRLILQALTQCLSLAILLQGLGMMFYGFYIVVHMDSDRTDWLGDVLILLGVLTFVMSFLGFYGSRARGIKEYLKVVSSTQFAVLSAVEAVAKLVVLLVFAGSKRVDAEMYRVIDRAIGFQELMSCSLMLDVVAGGVASTCMKSLSTIHDNSSYLHFLSPLPAVNG